MTLRWRASELCQNQRWRPARVGPGVRAHAQIVDPRVHRLRRPNHQVGAIEMEFSGRPTETYTELRSAKNSK